MHFSFLHSVIIDFDVLDESLVSNFSTMVGCLFGVLAALSLLLAASPWAVIALPFLAVFYKRQYDNYSRSNRELKRVGSARRSPVLNMFAEALSGYWCVIMRI